VSCTLGGLQGELLQNVFGVFLGPEASPEETQMAGPALSKPEFHELVNVVGTGRRRDKADRSARCPGRGQYGGAIQAHLTSPALQHEGRIGPEMSAGIAIDQTVRSRIFAADIPRDCPLRRVLAL
jgi:hypothetical protein